jgi:hypothetical protein
MRHARQVYGENSPTQTPRTEEPPRDRAREPSAYGCRGDRGEDLAEVGARVLERRLRGLVRGVADLVYENTRLYIYIKAPHLDRDP